MSVPAAAAAAAIDNITRPGLVIVLSPSPFDVARILVAPLPLTTRDGGAALTAPLNMPPNRLTVLGVSTTTGARPAFAGVAFSFAMGPERSGGDRGFDLEDEERADEVDRPSLLELVGGAVREEAGLAGLGLGGAIAHSNRKGKKSRERRGEEGKG